MKTALKLSTQNEKARGNAAHKGRSARLKHVRWRMMQRVIQRTKQEAVYSRLSDIPRGSASNQIVDGCLVLEGGAFRGLYTQGFLDAMMQNDLNMSSVIGVSACAHQPGASS